jgi:hypothetical protein
MIKAGSPARPRCPSHFRAKEAQSSRRAFTIPAAPKQLRILSSTRRRAAQRHLSKGPYRVKTGYWPQIEITTA